jgi:hypothetical protein
MAPGQNRRAGSVSRGLFECDADGVIGLR